MEQSIKINVPDGKKAVYDEATQIIKFVDIEPIRSESWKEFCENHPKDKIDYIHIDKFTSLLHNKLNTRLAESASETIKTEDARSWLIRHLPYYDYQRTNLYEFIDEFINAMK